MLPEHSNISHQGENLEGPAGPSGSSDGSGPPVVQTHLNGLGWCTFPQHNCGFPEEHVSKRAVRSLSVSIQIYDAIYLYAISFCHFTVGSVGSLLVSLQLAGEAHVYIRDVVNKQTEG